MQQSPMLWLQVFSQAPFAGSLLNSSPLSVNSADCSENKQGSNFRPQTISETEFPALSIE